MKNSKNMLMALVVFLVIAIIALIFYIKENGNPDEKVMKCIASKTKLIVSNTCSHCATQKEILGKYISYFEILSVNDNPYLWTQYNLVGVPTWIIEDKSYPGVKNIPQLKQLTGCG